MLRREYELAFETYQELVEFDPNFYKSHSSMGRVLSLMGRYPEAIAAFEKARKLAPDATTVLAALAQTLAIAGRTQEAIGILEELRRRAQTGWAPAGSFAIVHLGLGNRERALEYCEAAMEARERIVQGFKVHPIWAPLHSEPRFQALLRKANLLP
jgi:tetratricopeptide (TPR) repeat protein